jgi:hypothetical protein
MIKYFDFTRVSRVRFVFTGPNRVYCNNQWIQPPKGYTGEVYLYDACVDVVNGEWHNDIGPAWRPYKGYYHSIKVRDAFCLNHSGVTEKEFWQESYKLNKDNLEKAKIIIANMLGAK